MSVSGAPHQTNKARSLGSINVGDGRGGLNGGSVLSLPATVLHAAVCLLGQGDGGWLLGAALPHCSEEGARRLRWRPGQVAGPHSHSVEIQGGTNRAPVRDTFMLMAGGRSGAAQGASGGIATAHRSTRSRRRRRIVFVGVIEQQATPLRPPAMHAARARPWAALGVVKAREIRDHRPQRFARRPPARSSRIRPHIRGCTHGLPSARRHHPMRSRLRGGHGVRLDGERGLLVLCRLPRLTNVPLQAANVPDHPWAWRWSR